MGWFSKSTSDLYHVESLVRRLGQQLALYGRGLADPELLEEFTAEAAEEMRATRDRLIAEGRQKDLKALQKRLLSAGTYIDTPTYNRHYSPLLWECLDA